MPAKVHKIPMRMCVGCREMKEKRELIRVVKNAEGVLSVDLKGKASGRGAYLCRSMECFSKARKQHQLERALETAIPDDVYTRLEEEMSAGQ